MPARLFGPTRVQPSRDDARSRVPAVSCDLFRHTGTRLFDMISRPQTSATVRELSSPVTGATEHPGTPQASSTNSAERIRVPAEWEPHASTWLQWPKGRERRLEPTFVEIVRVLLGHERCRYDRLRPKCPVFRGTLHVGVEERSARMCASI